LFICLVVFAEEHPKLPPTSSLVEPKAPPATDSAKEAEDNLRKSAARGLSQSAKIRPWDFGKEGVPKKPGTNMFIRNSFNEGITLRFSCFIEFSSYDSAQLG
jgi:hypothetical protein